MPMDSPKQNLPQHQQRQRLQPRNGPQPNTAGITQFHKCMVTKLNTVTATATNTTIFSTRKKSNLSHRSLLTPF